MASELTIDYTLNYKVSIDVDKMKECYYDIVEEFEDDEEVEEWIRDSVLASLEDWEEDKMFDKPLPYYVTHFSVSESST